MTQTTNLTPTTSPQTQPARKFRNFANLDHQCRFLYGRTQRHSTGKEPDSETGLYYFGARYLDPKTSRWLSGDPAMAEYVPSAPVSEEARKRNGSLPGMGGVFNYVNLHVYHYAGNNPVKYTDPDGNADSFPQNATEAVQWANRSGNSVTLLISRVRMGENSFFSAGIPAEGPCLFMAYLGIAQTYAKKNLLPAQVNELYNDSNLYTYIGAAPGNTIIRTTLEKLGVDTSNLDIRVDKSPNCTVAEGAFATIRGVGRRDNPGSTSGHYQEGNNKGDFKWDAFDGTNDPGSKVGEIRNVFITTKPLTED